MGRDLQGRVAIVTGSGCGIGLGIAKKPSEKGASIVTSDMNEDNARNDTAEIEAMGGKAIYILADVFRYGDAQNLADATIKEVEGLDISVNSVGINKDRMLHKMFVDDWNAVIAVNLTGVLNCMRAVVNYMKEREYEHIINMPSASYLNGNIGQTSYVAAKAGVVALTKTCTKENGRKDITRNAIVLGFIDTEMTRGVPEKTRDIMVGKVSMGRAGTPEDIGNMITLLVLDEAPYITQSVSEVGGGMIL